MKLNQINKNQNLKPAEVEISKIPSSDLKIEVSKSKEVNQDSNSQNLVVNIWSKLKKLVLFCLNHKVYTTVAVSLAIYTIFASDTKNVVTSVKYDYIFDIIMTCIFFVFVNEFTLNLIFTDGYIKTFYCLFDLISFLALIPDVPMIWIIVTTF